MRTTDCESEVETRGARESLPHLLRVDGVLLGEACDVPERDDRLSLVVEVNLDQARRVEATCSFVVVHPFEGSDGLARWQGRFRPLDLGERMLAEGEAYAVFDRARPGRDRDAGDARGDDPAPLRQRHAHVRVARRSL
jgi:hypothetical protein